MLCVLGVCGLIILVIVCIVLIGLSFFLICFGIYCIGLVNLVIGMLVIGIIIYFVLNMEVVKVVVQEVQGCLLWVVCVFIVGELIIFIVYEVNQLLVVIVSSVEVCQCWFVQDLLNVDKVWQIVVCILVDVYCVGDVIVCIRGLIQGVVLQWCVFDLNQVVEEMLVLLCSELDWYGVVVVLLLDVELLLVQVDCVQVQQVIGNLIFNVVDVMEIVFIVD